MTTRLLPPGEWHRLVGTELEQAASMLPSEAKVLVTEDDGEIVACLTAIPMMHVEGIWVDPSHRGNGVGLDLWASMQNDLRMHGVRFVIAGSVTPEMDNTLTKLGATSLPGKMFVLPVRE